MLVVDFMAGVPVGDAPVGLPLVGRDGLGTVIDVLADEAADALPVLALGDIEADFRRADEELLPEGQMGLVEQRPGRDRELVAA